MSVTATFAADFTKFNAAVDSATVKMRSFEDGAAKVEKQLSSMTDSFSGRKLIQDATLAAEAVERIGGASKLTENELERVGRQAAEAAAKMRALGLDVPENIAKLAKSIEPVPEQLTLAGKAADFAKSSFAQMFGAFTAANLIQSGVSGLIAFGRAAVEDAGHLVDLSAQTGYSLDALQRMQFVASQTGGSLDDMTSAAFKLGVRLAGGSGSVRDAIAELGLSFDKIRTAKNEDAFERVNAALGKVTDVAERNRLGVELYGKTFESIAAGVVSGYDEMASAAPRMSAAQIRALDDAADAWDKFKGKIEKGVGQALGNFAIIESELEKMFSGRGGTANIGGIEIGGIYGALAQAMRRARGELADTIEGPELIKLDPNFVQDLREAEAAVAQLTAAQREQLDAAIKLGRADENYLATLGLERESMQVYAAAMREATAAADRMSTAVDAMLGTETLKKADALLQGLTALKNSGLTPVKDSFDDIAKAADAAMKVLDETGRHGTKMYEDLLAAKRRFSGLTEDGLIPSKSLGVSLTQAPTVNDQDLGMRTELYDASRRIAEQKAWEEAVRQSNDALEETFKIVGGLPAVNKAAGDAAVDAAMRGASSYDQMTAAVGRTMEALFQLNVPQNFDFTKAYRDAGFFVQDRVFTQDKSVHKDKSFGAGGSVSLPGLPAYGDGGIVTRPTVAMIGERGPEAIVPLNGNWGGGANISISIDASGATFDTPAGIQQLADRVGDTLVARLRNAGVRL